MSAFSVLLGGRATALIVGAAMALAAWQATDLWWRAALEAERASCAAERMRAVREEAAANAEALSALRRWADLVGAEAAKAVRESTAHAARLETTLKEIEHAPPEEDAPLAPVLRRALDGLRGARD